MESLENPPVAEAEYDKWNKREEKTTGALPASVLAMYEVSGQEKIGLHVLDRYLADKKRWEKDVDRLASTKKIRKDFRETIGAITHSDERAKLVHQALANPDTRLQQEALGMLKWVPYDERVGLIREAMNHPNIKIQRQAAEMIDECHPIDQDGLRQLASEKVHQALNDLDVRVQREAAGMVWTAPIGEQDGLQQIVAGKVRQGLDDPDIGTQREAARMIGATPVQEQFKLRQIVAGKVRQGLDSPDVEVRRRAVGLIHSAPNYERARLIREGLGDPDVAVQLEATRMIGTAAPDEQDELMKILAEKARQALDNPDISVQQEATWMIGFAPPNERDELRRLVADKIHQGLSSHDISMQQVAVGMIWSVPHDRQAELFELAVKTAGAELLVESPLYRHSGVEGDRFSREPFAKTGSETTLLGGTLKGKVIIRYIEPDAFLTWQKLYEDYALWQKNGFDYVPIEPINSFRLEKNGKVAVFSGVLDLNLESWEAMTPRFRQELDEQKKKILEVLDSQRVNHGHTHDANFCLRFFRDQDGKPDLERVPRLYLIDFDQAISP